MPAQRAAHVWDVIARFAFLRSARDAKQSPRRGLSTAGALVRVDVARRGVSLGVAPRTRNQIKSPQSALRKTIL
jgi:hypothetical protein